ncbi:hypothetical protein [Amycolatopsis sp. NPDC051716]|uniref:hypothetical protein n=1 Tax=Amycolatopsis sp. NPDC051716 TaxID=3155804 RepID=UPI003446823E
MSEEEHGPRLTEEIRLLAELVAEKAAPWLEGLLAAGHGTTDEAKPDGSACGWCPLCAIVAVVRGERPELVARLAEQLAQLVALLRAVLADRWEPEEGVHMPGFRPAARPAPDATAPARVQHIAVRRRDEWES